MIKSSLELALLCPLGLYTVPLAEAAPLFHAKSTAASPRAFKPALLSYLYSKERVTNESSYGYAEYTFSKPIARVSDQ